MQRAAVLGLGAIGKHHARLYHELDGVELVAVADLDEGRRAAAARRFKIPAYRDHGELFANTPVDLVSVAAPTEAHFTAAVAALEHGAHVLVEKPIAATVAEAQTLIDRARALERVLTVGHVERFNPAVVELKRRLTAGELGRVFQVVGRRLSPFPHYVRDVGVIMDLATHEVDILRYVVDSPITRLYAETARRIHPTHEDLLTGSLRFENDVVGALDINWLTPTKVRELRVTGERGMFFVDYIKQDLYFYENSEAPSQWETMALLRGVEEGTMHKLRVSKVEPLEAELRAFAQAARDRTAPVVSGEDGLWALKLAKALMASGSETRVIAQAELAQ
jgi:predicted dehydrogenase